MSTRTDLDAYLDQLHAYLLNKLRKNLKVAGARLETDLKATWPDVGEIHPYATGKSKKSIVRTAPTDDQQRVTVEAAYSGYTNHGYTRKGAKTAKSWALRNRVEGYGEDMIEASRDALVKAMKEGLDG